MSKLFAAHSGVTHAGRVESRGGKGGKSAARWLNTFKLPGSLLRAHLVALPLANLQNAKSNAKLRGSSPAQRI